MKNVAPIVLFVYNRPKHTKKTVEALLRNQLAEESDLYIYSDAPKNYQHMDDVKAVREYIDQISGFKSVTIIKRQKNWGLAASVIDGVTNIIHKHGFVIVLEDDLVVTPYFLDYMNTGLNLYQNEKKVFGITGYFDCSGQIDVLPESFFLPISSSWTWATWADRWNKFDEKAIGWQELLTNRKLKKSFDFHNSLGRAQTLINQMQGVINSWWIRWEWTIFQNHGLYLTPKYSLCSNNGFDGTGEHCGYNENKTKEIVYDGRVTEYPSTIGRDQKIEKKIVCKLKQQYYRYKLGRLKYYVSRPTLLVKKIREKQ